MPEEQGMGVNISLREIYDTIQEVKNEVKGIGPMLSQIERDAAKGVEAYDIAKEAAALAHKHEDGLKWIWRTVIGAFITGVIAAFVGFMVLSAQLGVENQIKSIVNTQSAITITPATKSAPTTGGNK